MLDSSGSRHDSRRMHALATSNPHGARFRAWLLLACAIGAGAAPIVARAWDWQVDVTPYGELFPGLELSQVPQPGGQAIGGGNGLVSVHLRGADLPRHLRLRIDTPGLREAAVIEVTRDPSDPASLDLHPHFDWDVAALRKLDEVRRQVLSITLSGDGTDEKREVAVRLHPLDDALYYVRENNDRVDLGWAFAGYVNPRDPVVDEVLALARQIDPDFNAAATATQPDLQRVAVIWAALEKRGLRYAAGDPALSSGPTIWSQRVRLPAEVWRDRRANCIDSSVLIASVVERIGLHAFIVLVPGHAFVGFRNGAKDRDAVYLETTLLGAAAEAKGNFAAARAAGARQWRKVANKLDGRHSPDYALVDIGTARAYGIIPIGAGGRSRPTTSGRTPSEVRPTAVGASQKRGSP